MHFFYHAHQGEAIIELTGSEARHCIKVLRCREGDTIMVTNGTGKIATCRITTLNKETVITETIQVSEQENPVKDFTLCITPLKNPDRTEWLLEKATELGVGSFRFILTRHCESKKLNMERMERVVTAALKQSQKHFKPQLLPLMPLKEFVKTYNGKILLATCAEGEKTPLIEIGFKDKAAVLIGPEGDFNAEEIEMVAQTNCTLVSLGSERLRSETAAMAATVIYNQLKQK